MKEGNYLILKINDKLSMIYVPKSHINAQLFATIQYQDIIVIYFIVHFYNECDNDYKELALEFYIHWLSTLDKLCKLVWESYAKCLGVKYNLKH